jgi:PIN domain nuclease of toxin-antitoxin system
MPKQLSHIATRAITGANELAVASITWYELAWLARNERIGVVGSVSNWLQDLNNVVRTIPISPAVADLAAAMPPSFPRDPIDRIILATAIEHGVKLVTRDERVREHPQSRGVAIW